jgi:hypothetical protein
MLMGAFDMHCGESGRERDTHGGGPGDSTASSFTLSAFELRMLDSWIERHPDPKPSRVEALHRLLAGALSEHPGQ